MNSEFKKRRKELCNSLIEDSLVIVASSSPKQRNSDADYNESAQTFIYAAFAEMPFKYATAR